MPSITRLTRGQRGMTLAEIVVASALALIGFLVALILYQAARDLFKRGEQAADQQQQVRLGFDQMTRDLRVAGFNTNPDGSKARVDEQIEGAWDNALILRADFDGEDTTGLARDPEEHIQGVFNIVSTGNDEIVGYVLRKPDGTGGSSIAIAADVHSSTTATSPAYGTVATRDNAVETVTIPNVALTQNNPPYTLYRVSLNNSSASWGTAGFLQFTPVADNVYSLAFTYYNAAGIQVAAPGGAETAVNARAAIKRIQVTLRGMTPDPDRKYTDSSDPYTATRNYRKFQLQSDVTPRNLGKFGVADIDLTPPSTPTGLATCPGHCQGMIVSWSPNPVSDLIAQYTVRYGTAIGALNTRRTTSSTYIFLPGLSMTTYYFQVRAEDAAGNSSPFSSAVSGIVRDDVSPTLTTPVSVDQGTATASSGAAAPNGRIDLTWTAPTQNNETITCDPAHTLLRDLDGYRIYRSESPSAGPGSPMVDETVQKTTAYSDASVVNCRDYYYFINAVDLCDHESVAWASSINGRATSGIAPMPPASANATRVSATQVQVTWASVTMDVVNNPIMIDTYEVWRAVVPDDGADPYSANYSLVATVAAAATSWLDTSAPAAAGGRVPYYKVRAKDDCPNYSDFSAPAGALCPFSGTVTLSPGDGAVVNLAPRTVTVTYSGSETLVNCQLVVTKVGGSQDFDQTIVGAGPVYTFTWMPGQGTGSYVAVGIVMNGVGCTGSATGNWSVITACPGTLTLNPASGSTLARQPQTLTSVYSGSDTMTSCRLEITKSGASVDFDQTIVGPGPTYVFTWTPSQGPGTYTARTTSTGVSGCTLVAIQTYRVIGEVVCCLSVDPGASTFLGSGSDMDKLQFHLQNTGGCTGSAVEITQMVVRMSLDETTCAGPPRLERVEAPSGTVHFTSGTGLSLPATANLFPTFTINNGTHEDVVLDFQPTYDAIGCKLGATNYRDRLASDFTFNRVGVIESVTCTTSDIPKINNGSPTP